MRRNGCPYCNSTRSTVDDGGERQCEGCGAVFPCDHAHVTVKRMGGDTLDRVAVCDDCGVEVTNDD